MASYLFNVRASLDEPQIMSWHQINDEKEQETKSVLFAMQMSATVNNAKGPLVVHSDDEMVLEDMETYIRTMNPAQLNAFIEESTLKVPKANMRLKK
jgi:hypothetical protein